LLALADPASPTNIIQAQRDYFGAHTYQLKTDPDGAAVHMDWENA
jgi:6-phosphogluconate dehydrogenase